MQLKAELKKHLIDDLHLEGVDPENIDNAAPLFGEGLGLDSLDAVELVVLLQKRFGVAINNMDEARGAFTSIDSLAGFIEERKNAG